MNPEIVKALKDIRQDFKDMRASLEREFRKENREIQKSLEYFNKCFEDLTAECKVMREENASIKAENAALSAECTELKKIVLENEQKITQLEQYSRNRYVEVKGIPTTKDESLPALLEKIGNAINEPITENDIEACHRVPIKNSNQSNIIVQFLRKAKCDCVIEKARKMRISTKDLGFSDESSVFLNEHLCPQLKKLLGMTVERKKEKGWRYTWTRGGKIYARKSESSQTVRIATIRDLDKIA